MLLRKSLFKVGSGVLKGNVNKCSGLLGYSPLYQINHIKNMFDENLKYQVEVAASQDIVQKTDRIYKPTYTIEFNRVGEVLLYSCDPIQHVAVYLKYPYVVYESLIPLAIWNWVYNPLDWSWEWVNMNLIAVNFLWIPRLWYLRSLQYKIRRLWLLRGGKVAKIETNSLAGDRFTSWVENYQFRPLTANQKNFDDRDNADFLETEGQLKHELAVQCDHLQEMGTTSQDIVVNFMREGIVHHPELFEAVLKGYNIDTTDFVINTADNYRSREGNYNQ